LHVLRPRALGQFALREQLSKLGLIICVSNTAWPQAIADGKADVVGGHDLADFVPMRVEKTFLMMRETPLSHDRAATRDDAGGAPRGERNVAQKHSRMHRKIIHTLFSLFD